jgi:cobalt/nickel transport system permease protein
MVCETFAQRDSIIRHIDPRARIILGCTFSLVIAVGGSFWTLLSGLSIACILAALARLPVGPLARRMGAVNVFVILVLLLFPFSAPGQSFFDFGPLRYSIDGFMRALGIGLKANAIVLGLTALLGTMELVTLGHALNHLRVPDKLVHLFLFTIRYVDLLHHEYTRLRNAMKVRCFRPAMDRRSYRAFAHLVGMLLVRSFDRSERIVEAMKCRGFRGRFYLLRHFTWESSDTVFSLAGVGVIAGLILMEVFS